MAGIVQAYFIANAAEKARVAVCSMSDAARDVGGNFENAVAGVVDGLDRQVVEVRGMVQDGGNAAVHVCEINAAAARDLGEKGENCFKNFLNTALAGLATVDHCLLSSVIISFFTLVAILFTFASLTFMVKREDLVLLSSKFAAFFCDKFTHLTILTMVLSAGAIFAAFCAHKRWKNRVNASQSRRITELEQERDILLAENASLKTNVNDLSEILKACRMTKLQVAASGICRFLEHIEGDIAKFKALFFIVNVTNEDLKCVDIHNVGTLDIVHGWNNLCVGKVIPKGSCIVLQSGKYPKFSIKFEPVKRGRNRYVYFTAAKGFEFTESGNCRGLWVSKQALGVWKRKEGEQLSGGIGSGSSAEDVLKLEKSYYDEVGKFDNSGHTASMKVSPRCFVFKIR